MQGLTDRVTRSLLQFPEATVQALGDDEITPRSVLRGKLFRGRNGLAWLARGPHLEVVNSVTGERLSAYRFRGAKKQPPTVRAVKEFSWQKRTGLLVGLEEAEGSVLCLYDLGISRVVKAVVLPGKVTAIEPITSHGGPRVSSQHLHQSLQWLSGVAAVATDVGHLLLVDLCLDDFYYKQNELEALDLEVFTRIPAEVPQRRAAVTGEGRHLSFQLQNPSGSAISTLHYISRSNQLVVGFSDGYLSLWNMKTLKREHHSQFEGGRIPVYAVTFQEPENDPRNRCYLWAVQSTQESEGDVVSLHLLQLAFGDRKRLVSGQAMYEGLEYCGEKYSLDLADGVLPLRGQTSNIKLLSCQTVEKFCNHVNGDESVNEVISPETSVSVFSWQVNTAGQGKPSTYLCVFDINCWYRAQMPESLRPEEFLDDCPYFALWSPDPVISMTSPNLILDVLVHKRSLRWGVSPSRLPPEHFFRPSTYNFDGMCLLSSGVVHVTCIVFQKETLNFLKKSGPAISKAILGSYNKCLVPGLLSPTPMDVVPSSLSQNDRDPCFRERAVARHSLSHQYGKSLPRVQRKLAVERAKPYRLPSSALTEVVRPKPLSTITKQDNGGKPHSVVTLIRNMLSKIREVQVANEQKTRFSHCDSETNHQESKMSSSENGLKGKCVCSSEERNRGAAEVEGNVPFPQEETTASNNLPTTEESRDEEMQPRDELLLPVPSKRGRRRPPSSSEVSENADLRLSKSALPQPEVTLPVTPRGNARKRAQNLLAADTEAVSAQDGFRSCGKVEISPPLTKLRKKCKGGKAAHPVQPKDLDPDLSVQFVFSPRLLKSRRTNVPSVSRIVKEPELPTKEEEDSKSMESVGKQKLKRGRTAKSKKKKASKYEILFEHFCAFLYCGSDLARAKVLATSASAFPGFTPKSILKSRLRTACPASPCASPRQSVTPPLRAKEPKLSFVEENSNAKWTIGNDRDPRLRERAVARHSLSHQYGKSLPRVQRKLAVERAKPYRLPSSALTEGKVRVLLAENKRRIQSTQATGES
ncbi:protein ELYS-like [Opisthocomus hoazin]|uniref:protein ELYS-like n=1 Tax=Opisthocomus hoazin TaxID=30419 RepID=UPI003F538FC6